ncbi:hypothetical protein BDV06DRAFT_221276 [Aspergillus oleicola]
MNTHLTIPIPFLALTLHIATVHSQIEYDAKTNHFPCPIPETRFCESGSLQGSSIISYTPNGKEEIRSCGCELAGSLPSGYEGAAVCYESASDTGDAICAYNGTGYTHKGMELDVPETKLCDEGDLPLMGLSARDGSDIDIHAPQLLQASLGSRPGSFTSATLSIWESRASDSESANITCTNPWSRKTGTGTSTVVDENLTLNIVVVIPTTGVPTEASQTGTPILPSTLSSSSPASGHVPTTNCLTNSPHSTVIPSTRTTTFTAHHSDSIIPAKTTLTLDGTPLPGPVGAKSIIQHSNDVEYLHLKTMVVTAAFAVVLWILILLGCF